MHQAAFAISLTQNSLDDLARLTLFGLYLYYTGLFSGTDIRHFQISGYLLSPNLNPTTSNTRTVGPSNGAAQSS